MLQTSREAATGGTSVLMAFKFLTTPCACWLFWLSTWPLQPTRCTKQVHRVV